MKAAETMPGRIYVHATYGIMERLIGGTQTAGGTFYGFRCNGIPVYIPAELDVNPPGSGADVASVSHNGVKVLEVERVMSGWIVRRWTRKGDLVNMGWTFSDAGLCYILNYYAEHMGTVPKWEAPLQRMIRQAAKV